MHDIHALDDLPENDMFIIQKRRRDRTDEELTPIGVRTGILKKSTISQAQLQKTPPFPPARPGKKQHTAILNTPSPSCLSVKFSSANLLVP